MQPKTLFITYNGVIRNSYYLSSTLFIFFFLLQQALPARQAHNQGLLLCASMGYCKRQLSVSSYRHPMHTKWAAFQCWMSLHARHRSSVSCLLVRSGELSTLAQGTALPAMLGWGRRECLNNIIVHRNTYIVMVGCVNMFKQSVKEWRITRWNPEGCGWCTFPISIYWVDNNVCVCVGVGVSVLLLSSLSF